MVIKDETGEIPCGRMFSVQKWDRAPGLPHCLQWCLQWYLQVPVHTWLFYVFGRTHIWISLVAHYWISLVALFLDLWTILRKLDFSVCEIY